MSHVMVNQIRRLPIKNPAKAVLWVIADIADEKGHAFPSQATIALECGITDRTVRNCIHALESCGVLVVNRSDSRHTTYSVTPEKYVQPERDSGTTFRNESKTNRNDVPVHRNIVPINRNDIPVKRNDVPPNHQLTINNPQVTPSVVHAPSDDTAPATKKPSPAKLLKDLGCDDQLASDFIAHRKAKKAAITQTALNLIVSQAAKAGISFSRAVEITIERNWVSFNASWKWQDDKQPTTQATWADQQNDKWGAFFDGATNPRPKTVSSDNVIPFAALEVRHG